MESEVKILEDMKACDICGEDMETVSSIMLLPGESFGAALKLCWKCTDALTKFLKARGNKDAP